ncbi:leucine zipper domain-containing protein [Streptomyces hundungensis]
MLATAHTRGRRWRIEGESGLHDRSSRPGRPARSRSAIEELV